MSKEFNLAVKERRTYYSISKKSPISNKQIIGLIENAVMYVPSAFNSQSARTVLLLNEKHDKFWQIVMGALRKVVPGQDFSPTEKKINSFAAGYGTILFFENDSVIKGMQDHFPSYKDNFPKWSLESNGMLQFAVWVALENEGLGASLQHYNPLIDVEVKKEWRIPDSWQLLAQMPFGLPTEKPGKKTSLLISEKLRVLE